MAVAGEPTFRTQCARASVFRLPQLYLVCQLLDEFDLCVFFSSRSRHTRYWRDWSSDVCSSDLAAAFALGAATAWLAAPAPAQQSPIPLRVAGHFTANTKQVDGIERPFFTGLARDTEIGRASWRDRVEISVGGVSLNKKNTILCH